jgi:hypothetical protein
VGLRQRHRGLYETIRLNPNFAYAYYKRGNAYESKDKKAEAMDCHKNRAVFEHIGLALYD